MKNLLSLAALLIATSYSSLQAQTVSDEMEMQAFARNFMSAYNRQDYAALREMYTADAVRMDALGKEIKGADSIATYFEEQFIHNNLTLLLRHSGIRWSDAQHAWVAYGNYEIYGNTIVYDIEINRSGSYANTMLKENGAWKIARSVLTSMSQTSIPSSPENIAIVDALYQSFAKGDVPSVLAALDENIVWNEAENFPYADRNPYIGPDAVLNGVFARIGAEWEYWNLSGIQLHNMYNDQVLATLRYQGKHKQTQKVIDAQTAHLWTLKNGKVVSFQQFTDTKQAAEAIRK